MGPSVARVGLLGGPFCQPQAPSRVLWPWKPGCGHILGYMALIAVEGAPFQGANPTIGGFYAPIMRMWQRMWQRM